MISFPRTACFTPNLGSLQTIVNVQYICRVNGLLNIENVQTNLESRSHTTVGHK